MNIDELGLALTSLFEKDLGQELLTEEKIQKDKEQYFFIRQQLEQLETEYATYGVCDFEKLETEVEQLCVECENPKVCLQLYSFYGR